MKDCVDDISGFRLRRYSGAGADRAAGYADTGDEIMPDSDRQTIPMKRFIVHTPERCDIGVIAHEVGWTMFGLRFHNRKLDGSWVGGQTILGCAPGSFLFFREMGEEEWPPTVTVIYSANNIRRMTTDTLDREAV